MSQSPPALEMDKKSVLAVNNKTKMKVKKAITVASFLLPGLTLYAIFMLYPMIDAIRYSFFDWDGASPSMNFVGLENYVQLTKRSEEHTSELQSRENLV